LVNSLEESQPCSVCLANLAPHSNYTVLLHAQPMRMCVLATSNTRVWYVLMYSARQRRENSSACAPGVSFRTAPHKQLYPDQGLGLFRSYYVQRYGDLAMLQSLLIAGHASP
jgi:hypothetical protein